MTEESMGFTTYRCLRNPVKIVLGNSGWIEALVGEKHRQLTGHGRRKDGFHHFQVSKKPCQNSFQETLAGVKLW
jgi:hypothetical protein